MNFVNEFMKIYIKSPFLIKTNKNANAVLLEKTLKNNFLG